MQFIKLQSRKMTLLTADALEVFKRFFYFCLVSPPFNHVVLPSFPLLNRPDPVPASSWSRWQLKGPSKAAGSCWSRRVWATWGSGRCFRLRIWNTSLWMINTALFTAMCPRLVSMRSSSAAVIVDQNFSKCQGAGGRRLRGERHEAGWSGP